MKIIIPMAGEGSRFKKEGYILPKPFIDVEGKPMIERLVDNMQLFNSKFIFLVRQEHLYSYNAETILDRATDGNYTIVSVEKLTEGAASTVLLAKKYINNEESIAIVNSDQLIHYNHDNFMLSKKLAGKANWIWTFHATDPKWSFVKTDDNGRIVHVAEKKTISNIATAGYYEFAKGCDFVWGAEEMIAANDKINGEFYVCPVYNYIIKKNPNVYPFLLIA